MRRSLILAALLLPMAGPALAQTKTLAPPVEGDPAVQQRVDEAYQRLQEARQTMQRPDSGSTDARQKATQALQDLRAAMEAVPASELTRHSVQRVQHDIAQAEQALDRTADKQQPRAQAAAEALEEVERSVSEYRLVGTVKR